MKKLRLPKTPSPAVELLKEHIREIWRPIDWEAVTAEPEKFDSHSNRVKVVTTFYTANAMAKELGVSVMTVTRAVHRGLILPARATSGAMLFTEAQLKTLRHHLIKP